MARPRKLPPKRTRPRAPVGEAGAAAQPCPKDVPALTRKLECLYP